MKLFAESLKFPETNGRTRKILQNKYPESIKFEAIIIRTGPNLTELKQFFKKIFEIFATDQREMLRRI